MGKNGKNAAWKNAPSPLHKVSKGLEKAEIYEQSEFRWRADWIDLEGPWSFTNADHNCTWKQVIPRLHEYETRKWNEIFGARTTSDHPMPVSKIEKEAQIRLKQINKETYETLYQINVRAGMRLWGIRDRGIFYLLWYDPHHTVYIQKS